MTLQQLEAKHNKKLHEMFIAVGKTPISGIYGFLFEVRQESIKYEREKISQMIKKMPDTFPELESDNYDKAYKDAKEYMLVLLKILNNL